MSSEDHCRSVCQTHQIGEIALMDNEQRKRPSKRKRAKKVSTNRIREHRLKLGLTQPQLAERMVNPVDPNVPVPFQQVSRYEKGEYELSESWIMAFAAALQVEPSSILFNQCLQPRQTPRFDRLNKNEVEEIVLRWWRNLPESVQLYYLDSWDTHAFFSDKGVGR